MKTRYRLTRRGNRGDGFHCVATFARKRTSLHTTDEEEARQIVEAKNQSKRQPVLNLQIAKAYLAGADNGITTRTWQNAIEVPHQHHGSIKPVQRPARRRRVVSVSVPRAG